MSDDLVSFKMLLVSGNEAERDLLRERAAEAAFPVDCIEAANPGDTAAVCGSLASDPPDFVFVDSKLHKNHRQALYQAALTSQGRPLVIFIGLADLAARELALADPTADGLLARPFDAAQASAAINICARARLPKQILVVDDSANVRAVVRKVLQTSRFRLEISEAADGASAIAQVSDRRFDFVLLDCNMPGIDGFATLDRLKSTQQDVAVVMTTSTRDSRLDDRARAAGADDFLFKPFYASDVDAVLARLLGLVMK
jgi:CheY-like chemotaxis protein